MRRRGGGGGGRAGVTAAMEQITHVVAFIVGVMCQHLLHWLKRPLGAQEHTQKHRAHSILNPACAAQSTIQNTAVEIKELRRERGERWGENKRKKIRKGQ